MPPEPAGEPGHRGRRDARGVRRSLRRLLVVLERGGGRSRGIWVPRGEGKDVWNLHCVTGGQWCRDLRLHVKPADRHGEHARGAPRASHVPSPVPHGP